VSVNGLTVTHELRPDKLAKLGDVAVGDLEGLLNRIRVRYIPLFSKGALAATAATSPPHIVPLRSAARTSHCPADLRLRAPSPLRMRLHVCARERVRACG
jgi:hypothetical protein